MVLPYPPFQIEVATPQLRLLAATDEMLERLVPVVRAGVVRDDEVPFDDPISFYEPSPEREWRFMRAIWRGRSRTEPSWWRLYFVVEVDGELVGMQDLIAEDFPKFKSVTTFSWLAPTARGRGLGRVMRAAILQLAFAGLGAEEATSEAFVDNAASNGVSRALGYEENGTAWATRRGTPCQLRGWKLSRARWEAMSRTDITVSGVEDCLPLLGLA
ncbi:MAG TPA: GNAT family protein [Mycobacteriales bacterium]|nr:GNAT family protein [Mycobacteriales bacterium]